MMQKISNIAWRNKAGREGYIDLPILEFIQEDQVVLLDGVGESVIGEDTIIVRSDNLFVTAVMIRNG